MDDHKHNYPTKVSLILRMVVSVYLLYLVWELREAPASLWSYSWEHSDSKAASA